VDALLGSSVVSRRCCTAVICRRGGAQSHHTQPSRSVGQTRDARPAVTDTRAPAVAAVHIDLTTYRLQSYGLRNIHDSPSPPVRRVAVPSWLAVSLSLTYVTLAANARSRDIATYQPTV